MHIYCTHIFIYWVHLALIICMFAENLQRSSKWTDSPSLRRYWLQVMVRPYKNPSFYSGRPTDITSSSSSFLGNLLLRCHGYILPAMSRRHCLIAEVPDLSLLQSFHSSLPWFVLSFRCKNFSQALSVGKGSSYSLDHG